MQHIDILIIDDEEKFADMFARRIGLRDCKAHVCYNGATALQWVKAHSDSVSLILLDLQLPDMYGTEVLVEIKKINDAIPVVILTGHGTEKDRQKCEQLGAHLFLHKPPNIDEIMKILEHIREMSA